MHHTKQILQKHMADALLELPAPSATVHTAHIEEAAIDLPATDDSRERGFIVHMYDDGFLRDA